MPTPETGLVHPDGMCAAPRLRTIARRSAAWLFMLNDRVLARPSPLRSAFLMAAALQGRGNLLRGRWKAAKVRDDLPSLRFRQGTPRGHALPRASVFQNPCQ